MYGSKLKLSNAKLTISTKTISSTTKETITTKFRNNVAHPGPGQRCKYQYNVSLTIQLLQN